MGHNQHMSQGHQESEQQQANGLFMGESGLVSVTRIDYTTLNSVQQYGDSVWIKDDGSKYGFGDVTNPAFSTMLVKRATIPEPSILAIFALALMGLGFRRRQKV